MFDLIYEIAILETLLDAGAINQQEFLAAKKLLEEKHLGEKKE